MYTCFCKSACEIMDVAFGTYGPFFRTSCVSLFVAKPCYQKVRIDPEIILGFG